MTDLVAHVALGNLVMSALIAVPAWGVDRSGRSPSLAHALWVLVLIKVLTPPVLLLPIVPAADPATATLASAGLRTSSGLLDMLGGAAEQALPLAIIAWAFGSAIVLTMSLLRIRRFDRLVRRSSASAPGTIRSLAADVASQIGLRRAPDILVTHAAISPMTWWTGGRVRVVLPVELCTRLGEEELRWVLGHELGHVKRRDHLVRWLEWVACVAFWWNPVVWLARARLRHDEEASCDALVVDRLGGRPQAYARTLLAVVEFLAQPAMRPPAVATGLDAGGRLERRFARILTGEQRRAVSRRAVVGSLGSALVLMTLGIGSAGVPAGSQAPPSALTAAEGAIDATADASPDVPPASVETYAMLLGRAASPATSPHRMLGAAGRDVLTGARGPDLLVGRAGRDRLDGRRGDDILIGGRGDDILIGGPGADTIRGGPGNDVVRTWQDRSPDRIDCGPGEHDRAIVDATDIAVACEVVVVR